MNTFNCFVDKLLNIPLWLKQVLYLRLSKELGELGCIVPENELFSTYVPILTFKGCEELKTHNCGLDVNTYNFLLGCEKGYSILEISVNTFLTPEEVSKYFELCIEYGFVETPSSKEIIAKIGYISGKLRLGEYLKSIGKITEEQLETATQKQNNTKQLFGDILVELGYIKADDLKPILILKDEAQKRFILDCDKLPNYETQYLNETVKNNAEISSLKAENFKLKQKLHQLLELAKR